MVNGDYLHKEMGWTDPALDPYPDGKLGVVVPEAYADILIVDGNPLEDILLLVEPEKNLSLIMKDGHIYKNTL